jgi:hypothetical protein
VGIQRGILLITSGQLPGHYRYPLPAGDHQFDLNG